jgi:hypothetical protein
MPLSASRTRSVAAIEDSFVIAAHAGLPVAGSDRPCGRAAAGTTTKPWHPREGGNSAEGGWG